MAYLATTDLKTFIEVAGFKKLSNGKSVIYFPNGDEVSVQPNRKIEHRPAGTEGQYEQCELDGSIAVYNPTNSNPEPFAYINGSR